MENDEGMQEMVNELLRYFCSSHDACRGAIATLNSSNPSGLFTTDFLQNIKVVTLTKIMMTNRQWDAFLAMNAHNMLSSQEMYLRYVMTCCNCVAHFTDNVFDKVLNVFVLVINLIMETLVNTGVNFFILTNDIFMAFYDSVLKEPFRSHGGMERLVEYVNLHEYLTWKWHWKDIISPYDPNIFFISIQNDLNNKFRIELAKEPFFPEFISHDHVLSSIPALLLAQRVLSSIRNQLPPIPSSDVLDIKLSALMQKKASKIEEGKRSAKHLESVLHRFLRSNPNSETNDGVEQREKKDWCENIVQAVIVYNNSKSLDKLACNKNIPKKANEILDCMKDKISCLIKIMDEDDKE